MAGDNIKMSDNALFLVHRASNMYMGNINDLQAGVSELKAFDDRLLNIYVKKTGKTTDEINTQLDVNNGNGGWLTADEAKELGFITEVFEPSKIAALASPLKVSQHKLPAIPQNKIKNQTMNTPDIVKSIKDAITAAFKIKNEEPVVADASLFTVGETITGSDSGATATIETIDGDTITVKDVTAKVEDTAAADAEAAKVAEAAKILTAKDLEIKNLKAEKDGMITAFASELAAAKAGETKLPKVIDPPPAGVKKVLNENEKALQNILSKATETEKLIHIKK